MTGNSKLIRELADFLARRGEYEADEDVYATLVADLRTKPQRRRSIDEATPEEWDRASRAVLGLPYSPIREAPEPGARAVTSGVKHDAGKVPLSLLGNVSRALADVVRSLAHGATKYTPDNWKRVESGSRRYRDAALRHLFADLRGERFDPEQGLPHVTIAALNLLLAAEHDQGFDCDIPRGELKGG